MDNQGKLSTVRLATGSDRHDSPAGPQTKEEIGPRGRGSSGFLSMEVEESYPVLQDSFRRVSSVVCMCSGRRETKTDFGHFEPGNRICSSVKQIEKRMEERVGLTLMRNCLLRLQASYKFINELEHTIEKYLSYYKDLKERGGRLERDFSFRGQRFHDLCQTAKDHLTFWSLFSERYSTETRLKTTIPWLENDLNKVHMALLRVIGRFTTLISSILLYVLDIAFYQQWQLSDDLLKDISASIEDLNRLLEYSRSVLNENDLLFRMDFTSTYSDTAICIMFGFCTSIRQVLSSGVCPVTLIKLFNDTARNRARILGSHVLSFLHGEEEINRSLKCDLTCNFEKRGSNKVSSDKHKLVLDHDRPVINVKEKHQVSKVELDLNLPLVSFESLEYQFITDLISRLATSNTLMSSHGLDKKLLMHKSLPQKGLYHTDTDATAATSDEVSVQTHGSSEAEAGHSILKHSPGAVSPRLSKRVQWHHSIDEDSKAQVSVLYMDIFWSNCSITLCQMLESLAWGKGCTSSIGPLPLWSDTVMKAAMKVLESLYNSESLPPDASKSLQLVSRYVQCLCTMSGWDKGFCSLLSIAQKDKCSTPSELEISVPSSKTVQAMVELLQEMRSFFEAAKKWKFHHAAASIEHSSVYLFKDLSSSVLPIVSRMQALLSFTYSWLDTKLYLFLSGWNLTPFLTLVHWDLPLLIDVMEITVSKIKPFSIGEGGNYSWGLLPVQLEELQETLSNVKGLASVYKQQFQEDLKKMCSEFFQEAMPIGKSWKKSRQSGIPCKPNSYVEHAIAQILEPVISGTSLLSTESQQSLLSLTTTIMMDTWSAYVLKEQIVFSFYGAQQLQLDFNYVKCWISSEGSGLSRELESHLLGLEAFHHLDGATRLLMLQPRKKKQMDELDVELESNISAVSSSSVLSSFSGVDIDGYEIDVLNDKTIPNKQHWLDLRLRGGKSKKGLLPFCLKVQETK